MTVGLAVNWPQRVRWWPLGCGPSLVRARVGTRVLRAESGPGSRASLRLKASQELRVYPRFMAFQRLKLVLGLLGSRVHGVPGTESSGTFEVPGFIASRGWWRFGAWVVPGFMASPRLEVIWGFWGPRGSWRP